MIQTTISFSDITKQFQDFLTQEEIQQIRGNAKHFEEIGKLSQDALNYIYEKQWFSIMVPESCGGMEWSFPKIVRLFEALAFTEGNFAWCVNLGSGANLFSGYLEKLVAQSLFSNTQTCLAGSGAISGKAIKRKDGFVISGKWKYASGSAHATHITCNCYLFDEHENPIMDEKEQAFRSFIIPIEQVRVLNTWNAIGLKASSSHDFEIEHVFVPNEHVFSLIKPSDFAQAPIFKYPFDVLAVVNMAIMPIGIASHFLELFEQLMKAKIPTNRTNQLGELLVVQQQFNYWQNRFFENRAKFYDLLDETWENFIQNGILSNEESEILKKSARNLSNLSKEMVFNFFPMCGMDVIYDDTELNKVWRDFTVAGQHFLLSPMVGN